MPSPLSDRVGGLPGLPGALTEVISAGDGVTYWGSAAKAERELGFTARPFATGVVDAFGPPVP